MKKGIFLICILFTSFLNAQFVKLLNFDCEQLGMLPNGGLVLAEGFLYGMNLDGGSGTKGILFKIKPDGSGYSKILDFDGSNGARPDRNCLIYDGTYLYGLTRYGGVMDKGVMFKIKPNGTGFVKLHEFTQGDGAWPEASLLLENGYLYGTTTSGGINGGGVIFKIKIDGTGFSKILDFDPLSMGSGPSNSLISDGNYLYGTAIFGGTGDEGVVFKIKTDGSGFSKIIEFTGANGKRPYGDLVFDGAFLYEMTMGGGLHDAGVLYKIKPDGSGYSKLIEFDGPTYGSASKSNLVLDGGIIYGCTTRGGKDDHGMIFRIKQDGSNFSVVWDFNATEGSFLNGSIISDGQFLYGMATYGGKYNCGSIYKIEKNTIMNIVEVDNNLLIDFFPNPVTSSMRLEAGRPLKDATVSFYDNKGDLVKTLKNLSNSEEIIACSDLAPGIYLIQISEDFKVLLSKKMVLTDKE